MAGLVVLIRFFSTPALSADSVPILQAQGFSPPMAVLPPPFVGHEQFCICHDVLSTGLFNLSNSDDVLLGCMFLVDTAIIFLKLLPTP